MNLGRSSLLALLALVLIIGGWCLPAFAGDDVYVHGYMRRDGTHVQPHMRSAPDSSYNNNWSTAPNVNPYTGQQGTRAPHVPDTQWGQPLGGLGNSGDMKSGGTGRRGW